MMEMNIIKLPKYKLSKNNYNICCLFQEGLVQDRFGPQAHLVSF